MILFTWAIGIVTTITQFIRPAPYLLNDTQASLFYFAPIVGSVVGEFWGHWFNDFSANRYIRTHAGKYLPENRLWGVYLPASLAATSLIIYGQTLQKALPIVALAAAWALMAFAQVAATTAISAYALDCFPQHAALASSWINFFRTTGESPLAGTPHLLTCYRWFLRGLLPAEMGGSQWLGRRVRNSSWYCWRGYLFCCCHPDLGQGMED